MILINITDDIQVVELNVCDLQVIADLVAVDKDYLDSDERI